jgi:RNA-directed DNA polymerase
LRLKVKEAKSALTRPEERKFLEFSISNDGSERRIAPKANRQIQDADPGHDAPTRRIRPPKLIEELAPYLLG